MSACYSVSATLTFRKGLIQTGSENIKEYINQTLDEENKKDQERIKFWFWYLFKF